MHIVAEPAQVLDWLQRGVKISRIADVTAWPPRQIRLLASRYGYLFTPDGTPYQPPASQRPRKS